MYAYVEQTIIERDGKDHRSPMLRDDCDATVLRVPEQFAGTLPKVANAEGSGWTHGIALMFVYPNRSTNTPKHPGELRSVARSRCPNQAFARTHRCRLRSAPTSGSPPCRA